MQTRASFGMWMCAVFFLGCQERSLENASFEWVIQPSAHDFGPTAVGTARKKSVRLRHLGRSPVMVTGLHSDEPSFKVYGFQPFSLAGGDSRDFELGFEPLKEGVYQGRVWLEFDAVPAPTEIPLQGMGVQAVVSLSSEVLDFGNVELGTSRTLEVELGNASMAEVEVPLRMEQGDTSMFSSSRLDTSVLLLPGEKLRVPFTFSPDRLALSEAVASVDLCHGCPRTELALRGFGISSLFDVQPMKVSFGVMTPHTTATVRVSITNLGTELLDFDGFEWASPAGPFSLSQPSPRPLKPGETLQATVAFSPVTEGLVSTAVLHVRARTPHATILKIPVRGEAGQPCVLPMPRSVDFGVVPEGMPSVRPVTLFNRCSFAVEVTDMSVSVAQGGFFSQESAAQSLALAPGAAVPVKLRYTPRAATQRSLGQWNLRIQEEGRQALLSVPLSGETRAFAPCRYRLQPTALEFGQVQLQSTVTLGVAFLNEGTDACFLSSFQLASGTDDAFTAGDFVSQTLGAGEQRVLPVSFMPKVGTPASGMVEVRVNHPTASLATAPIFGQGISGCMEWMPSMMEFGRSRVGCGTRHQLLWGVNRCPGPLSVSAMELRQSTSTAFALSSPLLPTVVAPQGSVSAMVSYTPHGEAVDSAAVAVTLGDGVSQTLGVSGEGVMGNLQTDTFLQKPEGEVDLLLVIDNSGSMTEEQSSLAMNLSALLSHAQRSAVDYRLAVTTTGLEPSAGAWLQCPGGAEGGEGGRFFPVDHSSPRILTPQTPQAEKVFSKNVQVGMCHWDEQGLEAAYRALSAPLIDHADDSRTPTPADGNAGFLRPNARLAIVWVSDEDDLSPRALSFYEGFFRSLKGPDPTRITLSAIVGPQNLASCPSASSAGTRYETLVRNLGGVSESICTRDWATSLQNVSTNSFGRRRHFELSDTPEDATQIEVLVDGVSLHSGWSFEASHNRVVFDLSSVPPAGAQVLIRYPVGC